MNYGNTPTVSSRSTLVCPWRVSVSTSAVPLVPTWTAGATYKVGQLVQNDTGKIYRCITRGTAAGSGGPTGTSSNITDNTVHWAYVSPSAFTKGICITNLSDSTILYWTLDSTSTSSTTDGDGIPPYSGKTLPIGINPTSVYLVSSGSITASAVALG